MTIWAEFDPPTRPYRRQGLALRVLPTLLTRMGAGRLTAARPSPLSRARWLPGPAAPHGAAVAAVPAATGH